MRIEETTTDDHESDEEKTNQDVLVENEDDDSTSSSTVLSRDESDEAVPVSHGESDEAVPVSREDEPGPVSREDEPVAVYTSREESKESNPQFEYSYWNAESVICDGVCDPPQSQPLIQVHLNGFIQYVVENASVICDFWDVDPEEDSEEGKKLKGISEYEWGGGEGIAQTSDSQEAADQDQDSDSQKLAYHGRKKLVIATFGGKKRFADASTFEQDAIYVKRDPFLDGTRRHFWTLRSPVGAHGVDPDIPPLSREMTTSPVAAHGVVDPDNNIPALSSIPNFEWQQKYLDFLGPQFYWNADGELSEACIYNQRFVKVHLNGSFPEYVGISNDVADPIKVITGLRDVNGEGRIADYEWGEWMDGVMPQGLTMISDYAAGDSSHQDSSTSSSSREGAAPGPPIHSCAGLLVLKKLVLAYFDGKKRFADAGIFQEGFRYRLWKFKSNNPDSTDTKGKWVRETPQGSVLHDSKEWKAAIEWKAREERAIDGTDTERATARKASKWRATARGARCPEGWRQGMLRRVNSELNSAAENNATTSNDYVVPPRVEGTEERVDRDPRFGEALPCPFRGRVRRRSWECR